MKGARSSAFSARTFARFAWALLAYDVGVVAWGAYVRATGSGAGCGRHWPTCNGEIVPRAPRTETLVEMSHRVSSAGAFVLTLVLFVWALRLYPSRHPVRRSAGASLALMAAEAVIGAGLVLFELVAHDASLKRALGTCLHLLNTFLLLGATSLTAFWASGGGPLRARLRGPVVSALAVLLFTMLVVGASGAVTALGDTLFPPASLAAGFAQDFAPSAHIFIRLRAIHPILAVATASAIVIATGLARSLQPTRTVERWSRRAAVLAIAQVAVGLLDMLSRAALALQLVHVVLADAVWIALVLTTTALVSEVPSVASTPVDAVVA